MAKSATSIPITIQPFFWVVAAIIGWLNTGSLEGAVIWALIIFVSILVHEFGHALSAIAFGQSARIELMGFGGMTYRRGELTNKWKEFLIILSGPIAGFSLAFLAWWGESRLSAHNAHSLVTYILLVIFYVNTFWTIVNLLPIQPMDGGKLMAIFLESIFGTWGLKLSYLLSIVLATVCAILFMIISQYLAASLFFLFAFESYQFWKQLLPMQREDQDPALQERFRELERYLHDRDHKNADKEKDRWARSELEDILHTTPKGLLYTHAAELYANLITDMGDYAKAYETLSPLRDKISAHGFAFLHFLAFKLHKWDEVIKIGDKAYQNDPNYHAALSNAIAYATRGEVKPSIGWLQCAINEGMPNVRGVLELSEFNTIRQDPLFQKFLNSNKG